MMTSSPHIESLTTPSAREDRAINNRAEIEGLIAAGRPIALFLDIDGTLLEVATTPSAVRVPTHLARSLTATSFAFEGALAIITGRRLSNADELLKPFKCVASGVHGAEMRTSPSGPINQLSPTLDPAIAADVQAVVDHMPGIVLEHKGAGLALHYRLAPQLQPDLLRALQVLLPKHRGQFTICGGRKVIEILPIGFSKGLALRKIAMMPPFAQRIPVMIGDDIADESAFIVANELGGFGLKVAGENFPSAEADFEGPTDVLAWLARIRKNAISRSQRKN